MASRSKAISNHPRMIRRSSAVLGGVLAFAAGLLLGAFAAGFAPHSAGAPASSGAGVAASGASSEAQAHISTIEQMTQAQPDNASAWVHLGDAYYDAGQPDRAIAAYERGLALDPGNADARTDLGTCYRLTGRFEQAVAQYNEALARNPRHLNARMNKGIVLYFDLGRKQEALQNWEALLAIAPDVKAPDGTPLRTFIDRHTAK